MRELGVDALAAGVLKYLLGSAGLGFLWTRPGLAAELLPTQTGWFADRNIFEMDITDYSPSPRRRGGSSPERRRSRPSTRASPASS